MHFHNGPGSRKGYESGTFELMTRLLDFDVYKLDTVFYFLLRDTPS